MFIPSKQRGRLRTQILREHVLLFQFLARTMSDVVLKADLHLLKSATRSPDVRAYCKLQFKWFFWTSALSFEALIVTYLYAGA